MRRSLRLFTLLISITAISCSSGSQQDIPTNVDSKMYNVNIEVTPSGEGSVQPSADSTYEEGTVITIEATGSEAFGFNQWSGDIESNENPYSLTVNQDYKIAAEFVKKQYNLTIKQTGDGTVEEQVVQSKKYGHGTVVELKANPATAYEFTDWTGDLNSADNPKTIVMDGPKTVTANFDVKPSKAAFKVNINWQKLSSSTKMMSKSASSVTHFGARLVYPDQNAAFAQSVEKKTADSAGVITMEVPPADSARLVVAAVEHGNGTNQVLKMGILEDLTIQQGKSYEWTEDDLTWSDPFWKPADSLASEYESGTFTVDKDRESFEFFFLVRDPYYPKEDPPINDYLIRLNGYGGNSGYKNGFRIMRQIAENPTVGSANQSTHDEFYPYLKSELFQLPSEGSRYVVYEKGSFTVSWE